MSPRSPAAFASSGGIHPRGDSGAGTEVGCHQRQARFALGIAGLAVKIGGAVGEAFRAIEVFESPEMLSEGPRAKG